MSDTKLLIIGGAAFLGAMYFFGGSGTRKTTQPVGASSYVGKPAVSYTLGSTAPVVYVGTSPTVGARQSSVTDALFGGVVNMANSTQTIYGL